MRRSLGRSLAVALGLLALTAATVESARMLQQTTTKPNLYFVYFGDSLTSTQGKGIHMAAPTLDPYTGYCNGRCTNGANWADYLNDVVVKKARVSYKNYAMGGATACKTSSFFMSLPYMSSQTSAFQSDVAKGVIPAASNSTVTVIAFQLMGANDVSYALGTTFMRSSSWYTSKANDIITCRMVNVDAIVAQGYKNVVLLPVPPVQDAPANPFPADTTTLVEAINNQMVAAVASKQASWDAAPAGSAQRGAKLWYLRNAGQGELPFAVQDRPCWNIPPTVEYVTKEIAQQYTRCTDPENFAFFDNGHPTTAHHSWYTSNNATGVHPLLQGLGLVPK